jgi:RNA polymerase sigma factor (sigma-70 family)
MLWFFFATFVYSTNLLAVEKLKNIVEGCLKNNRQAQSELYKMFAPRMYGVCLRYAGNSFDAQDILQEGFVKVFENLKNFKGSGSLEGWMKRIIVHVALDKYRSRITHLSVDEMDDDVSDQQQSAVDTLSEKEILALIQQLPDQYRMVFNLYILEGMSHHEISQTLNIGVSTSRSNLARAKALLKEKIDFQSNWIEKVV